MNNICRLCLNFKCKNDKQARQSNVADCEKEKLKQKSENREGELD